MIKRFYTAFTIYIMVMLYAPPVYSINFFFSHLGVEDGLSQVSVLDIFQDSDGYIWFGRATARTATMATNSLSIKTKSTIMQH